MNENAKPSCEADDCSSSCIIYSLENRVEVKAGTLKEEFNPHAQRQELSWDTQLVAAHSQLPAPGSSLCPSTLTSPLQNFCILCILDVLGYQQVFEMVIEADVWAVPG